MLLLAATIRGIVGLVISDSIDPDAVDGLIDYAITTFIRATPPSDDRAAVVRADWRLLPHEKLARSLFTSDVVSGDRFRARLLGFVFL